MDALDGDADDEPTLGAPKGWEPSGANVGRWMADQLDRLNGESGRGELYCDRSQSQETWAAGGDVGEREDVSEDEGAQHEDDDDELDGTDSEDEVSSRELAMELSRAQLGRSDPMAYQKAQKRTAEACGQTVEALRIVQRKMGLTPVNPLRTVGGAIVRDH
ncbi:MAG: hypothetical protein U1E16_04020 [Hyphomicrobiales bacterium]